MNTPITNGILNSIAQAKRHHIQMTELRMTNRQFDALQAEVVNQGLLVRISNKKPEFAGLPIVIDDRYGS